MENSNYYPLRVGKFPSCIVSDMPVKHRNKKDMDDEWEHYGGFVIAESLPPDIAKEFVELFNKKYECTASPGQKCMGGQMCCQGKISHHEWVEQENAINRQNSAHSFTEGMEMDSISNDPEVFKTHEPTIDDQIAFMRNSRHSILGSDDAIYTAIIHNLESIKRWNETPVYHGEIDVAKVIEDLLFYARFVGKESGYSDDSALVMEATEHIKKAERAIDMINRFKEEREAGMAPRDKTPGWALEVLKGFNKKPNITAKDVAEAHHAGVNILNRKAMSEYIPQVERDLLVNDLVEDLSRLMDAKIARRISNVIVMAIESMDHLKRKHGR